MACQLQHGAQHVICLQAGRAEEGVRAVDCGLRCIGRGKQDWHYLGSLSVVNLM